MKSHSLLGLFRETTVRMGISKRFLRYLVNPVPEIVIGGNSVHFFTAASLNQHPKHMHDQLKIIHTGHWLDDLHSDYSSLKWGQSLRGLPWFIRQELIKLFPLHHPDDKITFGQIKEYREFVLEDLQKRGIPLLKGVPMVKDIPEGYQIDINGETFTTPKNTLFYHSFRTPRIEHGLGDHLPKVSHTDLYTMPREALPKSVILLGGGRSTVWAARNFPEIQFACITMENGLPLFSGESMPTNITLYPLQDFSAKPSRLTLTGVPHRPKEAALVKLDRNVSKVLARGHFYCAIGMTQRPEITACVDPDQLILYPNREWAQEWVAPRETPVGCLMEATLRWADVTGNLAWAEEPACFHGEQPEQFLNELRNHVELPETFTDFLREEILKTQSSMSDEACFELYLRSLQKAYDYHQIPLTTDTIESLKNGFEKGISELSAPALNTRNLRS